jgi:hypothetical protein
MANLSVRASALAALGAASALFMVVLLGCGGPPPIPTGTVSGKVTHHGGKPLKNAEITFIAPQVGSNASAVLDAEGNYSITTPLKAGKYQIMVAPPEETFKPGDAPATKPRAINENRDIPAKVRNVATSGLTAEIKEGKNENVNFDLME